jgi:YidC/Oxa1 family membrane protein insertase
MAAEKAEDAERILARAASLPSADAEPIGEPKTIGSASDDTSVGVSKKLASSSPLSAAAHPAVLFALGQTRAKLKLWRGAAAAYDACAAGEADVERRGRALAGAGVATANAGDSLGATARLEAALKIRPRDVSCLISLAAVRKKQGDVREALAVLERAAEIAPEVRARFIEPLERETSRIRETERATKRRDKNAQKKTRGTPTRR